MRCLLGNGQADVTTVVGLASYKSQGYMLAATYPFQGPRDIARQVELSGLKPSIPSTSAVPTVPSGATKPMHRNEKRCSKS